MYQAYAYDILNQKQPENAPDAADNAGQPLYPLTLHQASSRLAQALDHLEYSLQQTANPQPYEQLAFFEQENNALKRESDALRTALAQLQEQYGALCHVAAHIHDRLDASIQKISEVIDA